MQSSKVKAKYPVLVTVISYVLVFSIAFASGVVVARLSGLLPAGKGKRFEIQSIDQQSKVELLPGDPLPASSLVITNNSTDPCYGFIAVDFPTTSDGQIAFEWELGTGWSELSRSGGHVVFAYGEKNGEMIEIGRTGSTEPLTDAFVLKNMDMDTFAELPDDVGVEYEVITINVNSCGSSTSEAWAAANSGG